MKNTYKTPKAVTVSLMVSTYLLAGSNNYFENNENQDAGAKRNRGILGTEDLFYEEEDE